MWAAQGSSLTLLTLHLRHNVVIAAVEKRLHKADWIDRRQRRAADINTGSS